MEAAFEIDGASYPIPTFASFTLDEAQVFYDYSGYAVEDFAAAHPKATEEEREAHEEQLLSKVKNPGFKKALLHIAIARQNPNLSASKVRETAGKANIVDVTLSMLGEDDDESPPEESSQSEPSPPPEQKRPTKSTASGSPSTNGSDEAADQPESTGTTESGTSSLRSVPDLSETSA